MSHQDRRLPLPADYQFPTHGVDCDCPTCRNRVTETIGYHTTVADEFMAGWDAALRLNPTVTAYGWGV